VIAPGTIYSPRANSLQRKDGNLTRRRYSSPKATAVRQKRFGTHHACLSSRRLWQDDAAAAVGSTHRRPNSLARPGGER
jgi:hypothetical protein